jgi:hypothetical protein
MATMCDITPAMTKLTTIIDKSWLQRICQRPDIADRVLGSLIEKCRPVAAVVLVEEITANRFQPGMDQAVVSRMGQAVLDFHPHWMEPPAELAFRELINGELLTDAGLPPDRAGRLREALLNPETASPSLAKWATNRYEEKKQRLPFRKRQQKEIRRLFQEKAPALLRPLDLATFAKNGSSFLAMVLNKPSWKQVVLEAYLGQIWRREAWHSDCAAQIDRAFAQLDYELLLKLPATHSYLLAELLYDVGPITKIGPPETEKTNRQVLSGNQINNEEDQEYVASALHCDRLLTCDENMHWIAEAFRRAGFWKGSCIFIRPEKADKFDRYCRKLAAAARSVLTLPAQPN